MITLLPLRGLAALAYMGGIYTLSSLPARALADVGIRGVIANLGHVPLFAGLGALLMWSLLGPVGRCFVAVLVIGCAFAVADEWHQRFVPNRVASAADLAADALGIVIGAATVAGVRGRAGTRGELER